MNLFEFPLIETENEIKIEELITQSEFRRLIPTSDRSVIENVSDWKIHILSHQRIHYRFIRIQLADEILGPDDLIRVNKEDIFNFAVPKLLEAYLNEYLEK
jgi:A/G-specific adenine glycosylase